MGLPPHAAHRDGAVYVIRGGHVVTVDDALGDLSDADVLVRDGVIVAVGRGLQDPDATVIDASEHIVMPGFVDTHWHLWNSALRSLMVDGDPARQYFPVTLALGPYFEPEDTYAATRLGLVEGISAGITTVHDWSHNVRAASFADASIRALHDGGVRARFSYGWAQQQSMAEPIDFAPIAELRQRIADDARGMLSLGFASRNLVPGQSLRGSIPLDVAHRDWAHARELDLPVTLHASPAGLVTMLDAAGLLGGDVLLVHPTRTTAAEDRLVAAHGAAWSTSPQEEAQRAPGEDIRFTELDCAGVRLGLSTDTTCTNSADMFAAMRVLQRVSRHRRGDAAGAGSRRMLRLATLDGARLLGMEDVCGSLTPGKRADIVLVNRRASNMAPAGDPVTQLVQFAQPRNIDTVLIDGRVVLRNGLHVDLDIDAVVDAATRSQAAVAARAGWPHTDLHRT